MQFLCLIFIFKIIIVSLKLPTTFFIPNHIQNWNRLHNISTCLWTTSIIINVEYLLPFRPKEHTYPTHVRMLTSHLLELEKLHEGQLLQ